MGQVPDQGRIRGKDLVSFRCHQHQRFRGFPVTRFVCSLVPRVFNALVVPVSQALSLAVKDVESGVKVQISPLLTVIDTVGIPAVAAIFASHAAFILSIYSRGKRFAAVAPGLVQAL
jgi:hypothetical protein